MLNIYTGLGKSYAEKALDVILQEVDTFSKEGISEEVLAMNKEKIKANYILGLESTSSRMFGNAKSILFKGKVSTQEEVIKKVDKISMDDIDFVLKECFQNGVLNASYVGNNVDYNKLDKILNNSSVAYRNFHNKDILL